MVHIQLSEHFILFPEEKLKCAECRTRTGIVGKSRNCMKKIEIFLRVGLRVSYQLIACFENLAAGLGVSIWEDEKTGAVYINIGRE